MDWRKREPRKNWSRPETLLDSLKGIRNNLFHGGKELRGRAVVNERDADLLRAGLTVLHFVISLDAEVAQRFSDLGPEWPVA